MDYINASLIFIGGLNIGSALIVLLRNYKNKINIFFAITVFFLGLWALFESFFRQAEVESSAFLLARLENTCGFLVAASFFFFVHYYPYKKNKLSILKLFLLASVIFGTLYFIWSPYYVADVIVNPPVTDFLSSLLGRVVFTSAFIFFILLSFWTLLSKYMASQGVMRADILTMMIATGITSAFGIYFGVLQAFVSGHNNVWYAPHFSISLVVLVGWLIFRR